MLSNDLIMFNSDWTRRSSASRVPISDALRADAAPVEAAALAIEERASPTS
jgi:hypothetical protein